MASWTDPSRQYLITSIRERPVIWAKSYIGEANYKTLKQNALNDVTASLNQTFPTNFTSEDVRTQWKNLKDTFVRKLRWVHEGKYVEDAIKEPTWKFYRMLMFLDDKEAKRLADPCEHTYELAPSCGQRQQIQLSYEPTSSQDQMLQLFSSPPDLTQHQTMLPQLGCSPEHKPTNTLMTSSGSIKRSIHYSPPNSHNGSSSEGVEEDDEDNEPERKKIFRRQIPSIAPMQVIATQASPELRDEFDHFGAMVASNLRRLSGQQGHVTALRVQRRLYDALFLEEQP